MFKLPGRSAQAAVRAVRRSVHRTGRTRALLACAARDRRLRPRSTGLRRALSVREPGRLPAGRRLSRTLPRDHPTPVSVRLQAGIQTRKSIPLPRVKKISLELAYRGTLDTEGLPLCRRTQLRALDTRHALATCGVPRRQGKPLLTRLRALSDSRSAFISACSRSTARPVRAARRSGFSPTRRILPSPLSCRSTSIARRALPHRAGQRRAARRRHLASFRPLQHRGRPPL